MMSCLAISGFVFAIGCGAKEPPASVPSPPNPPEPALAPEPMTENGGSPAKSDPGSMVPTPADKAAAASPPTDAPAPASNPPPALTDDQILYVLHTANAGEIEQAHLARQKAKNARVKQFASMMIKDHSDADKKGTDVAKKAKASPSANDVSKGLESDAKQMTTTMSSQKGADFDRSYMDAQVKEHQAVLDLIDKQLAPNAKSTELKTMLQTIRPKIEGHLKHAQEIQKNL